ncbi:MAG TPA: tRNA (adenosine(37)-N6)-threonylcarbamoyltransferase complex ATPase subunit type 1 TsaE [Verrucomicrobiae bacterium]|nr:tRNA (adenosine(37)-N6)-threonylcarbamoyltransferase complex ATPase subunit type 1 TsaE [Verrucomicrobiae bacterium]
MKIGRKLQGGEVIELISDLGGGKTTFVRGLAKGMGSQDTVRSPSFTLSNEYRSGKLTLYHFDFYRLEDPGIMRRELAEVLEDPGAVIAVEWPGEVAEILPQRRLTLRIHPDETNDTKRELHFSYPASLEYLVKGMDV